MSAKNESNYNFSQIVEEIIPQVGSFQDLTLPFPLENVAYDIATVYAKLESVRKKFELAQKYNVSNIASSGRQKKLLFYKKRIERTMSILKEVYNDLNSLAL